MTRPKIVKKLLGLESAIQNHKTLIYHYENWRQNPSYEKTLSKNKAYLSHLIMQKQELENLLLNTNNF